MSSFLRIAATLAFAWAGATASFAAPPAPYEPTPEMIEGAKKEGKVVWYTSVDLPLAEKIAKSFEAKFPGVAVRVERTGAERVFQRIGQEYGSKNIEFARIASLPRQTTVPLTVALGGKNPPAGDLARQGWNVVDAPSATLTPEIYRDFIAQSRGEISTAKNVYVALRTGWFSCRTACYLAAGRPAIGVTTLIAGPGANVDWDANSNECVIVPTREFLTAFTSVFPESEDNGRVTRKLLAPDSTVPDPKSVWTDDRNATVEMMNLGSFLSWRNRF
mgnify:CR=1 FL=1